MTEIARIALIGALPIAIFAVLGSVIAVRRGLPELMISARRALLVACVLVSVASLGLIYALLSHDFQVSYVHQYSSREMGLLYLISAFWAGNEGSLLLWAWVLSIFAAIVVFQTRRQNQELAPYVFSITMGVLAFFLGILVFIANPFARMSSTPVDGLGLNPLLENPGMFFHPTTLYLGYVGFTIPFAFALAALITGRLGPNWIRSTRRWTLFAWLFLALGNLIGAQWAYVELGWGGYWGWDPVESASFMPWLVATAYLHSVMIQQRRGMLKVWNLVLIMVTFVLVLFGTFLTRSGVLASVHTFGQSSLGPFFLGFIGLTIISCLGLLLYRLPQLKGENEIDSLVSRESSFLLNNVLFVGLTFAVFLGTVFPLISEAVRGVKVSVGPPFFNWVSTPIFLLLIGLMGICPLIGWRRASRENLLRNFLYPFGATLVGTGALYAVGVRRAYVILALALCLFVVSTILLEVFRGMRARHRFNRQNYAAALLSLVWRNKPRYGGYLVHLGIVVMAIAIVASSAYKIEASATLARGESMQIEGYVLTYQGLTSYPTTTRELVTATLEVSDGNGQGLGVVTPAQIFHRQHQPVTEVAIRSTLSEDLYVILVGWEEGLATFKVFVNPMMMWLWIGGALLILGTVIAFWPDARERRRLTPESQPSVDVTREVPGES